MGFKWWDRVKSLGRESGDDAPESVDPQPGIPASADTDWIRAKAHIRERLVSQRRNLETLGLSHSDTEGLRYAIVELEGVLNFQKPSKMAGND